MSSVRTKTDVSSLLFNTRNKTFLSFSLVPTGSPSRGGDVAVYVFDINQPSLPTPFYSVLVSIASLYFFVALSTVSHSINKYPDNVPLSHSIFPFLSLPYWFFQLHIS